MKSFKLSNRNVKILSLGLTLMILLSLLATSNSQAKGLYYGSSIQSDQVINQNLILSGTDINIDGNVKGDVLAVGRVITVNGEIDGTLVAIGEMITINNQVNNNVIASSVLLQVDPGGIIGREIYFFGVRLNLPEKAEVGRDLYCMSLEAQLSGSIGRDIHAIIGPVKIFEFFRSFIEPYIQGFINPAGARLPVSVIKSVAPNLVGSMPVSVLLQADNQQKSAGIDVERVQKWGFHLLRSFVSLFIIGLLSLLFFPTQLNTTSAKVQNSLLASLLTGIVFFITGWFALLLALVIVVVITIFLFVLTLPNLAMLFGFLGVLSIGLVAAIFWLAIAYGSKIVVSFLVGRVLLQKVFPKIADTNLWPLLLGIVLYALITSIPYLGWVIATIITFIGLGSIWLISSPTKNQLPVSEMIQETEPA